MREITATNIHSETSAWKMVICEYLSLISRMKMQFKAKKEEVEYHSDKKDEEPYLSSRNIRAHIAQHKHRMCSVCISARN